MTTQQAAPDVARVQRRTVGVLSGAVALAGLGVTVGITIGGLLAREVAGSDAAAGLGQTAGVLGAAVLAVPLARLSDRAGRRAGLAAGYAVAVAGALVTVLAAALSSLPLLLAGLFAFGASTACGLQARYAAADLATPERRGRDLSLVVWATTVGSVLGPNLAAPGAALGRAVGLPELGGGFVVSAVGFAVVAAVLLALLRPDPLLLSRRLAGGDGARPAGNRGRTRAALREVWASADGRLGVVAVVVAHSVMVGVMVMTPVHMGHAGGHDDATTLRLVGVVISVHVAGMYLFSPLVGWLADRAGRRATVAAGGMLLLAAAAIAGTAPPEAAGRLGVGLLLLGLGWSCGLIAGSTLVTESVPAATRPAAQGGTDLLMGLGAAVAGAAGGPLLAAGGFGLVAGVSAALVLPLALVWALRR
ncbi:MULTISPECIES: MFS transporter [Geodermatophilus]|uniref:Predicted arabinose efflux permease, MFS family n=1 Tax=Geodermatophilus nigrescens TaxID=1070870 RepID=A0A1M5K4I1_9ACTN|nr:MFS transporter [Geodermatophilus nigrescens]SHG47686.1 Predicted arabinose efflux permease, MFS family [Geodermatophilus nigrescens]